MKTAFTVLVIETKEYQVTIAGKLNEDDKETCQNAIESATNLDTISMCLLDEGASDVEIDKGRLVSFETEVTGINAKA